MVLGGNFISRAMINKYKGKLIAPLELEVGNCEVPYYFMPDQYQNYEI